MLNSFKIFAEIHYLILFFIGLYIDIKEGYIVEVTIRPNDSIWYYSQLFSIPAILIEKSNPDKAINPMQTGDILQIPGYILHEYIAHDYDSLWKIANHYHLPMDALILVNPFVKGGDLYPGQRIYIPEHQKQLIVPNGEGYTYETLEQTIERLVMIYPFITAKSVGKSVMDKHIIELQIGMGDQHVHINSAFHANEWITTSVIMKFLNEYALSLTNNTSIRDIHMLSQYMNTRLSIVPMVNPDGVDLVLNGLSAAGQYRDKVCRLNRYKEDFTGWKANIRGVDLNKQYPAGWEKEADRKPKSPGPRDFPGDMPLTEPESIAMNQWTKSQDFDRVMALHTQGKEIYWEFNGLAPAISACMVEEYERVSGYAAVRELDNYAGFKDWFIQTYQRPGFTVELGSGNNPLPIEQFSMIYEECLGILLAYLYI